MRNENGELKRGTKTCAWHAACDRNGDPRCKDDPHLSTSLAGVTIFAMLVPQGMAYGELAGVAPVAGLYTAIGALVGYALFGSSRRLMIGPEASSAILVATTLAPIAGRD